jgi:hypothetical protein
MTQSRLFERTLVRHNPVHLSLFIVIALSASLAFGQASHPGAINKKPRTIEDYKPATLKEIVSGDLTREGLRPFRVRVTYTGNARPISTTNNDSLNNWARCCAGNPDHYKGYIREVQFVENGIKYWLAAETELIADLQEELKIGDVIELFLIRLSPPSVSGKMNFVLVFERFQRAGASGDQVKETLNWIKSNLSSYTAKKLSAEIPAACQLKITDSSTSTSVSKAVVFLTVTDLDASKVSVQPIQDSDMWNLWLHATAGKRSIRFMLYQGGPAEGAEAATHSLTFRDQEEARTMAEAFRRAINICAAANVD